MMHRVLRTGEAQRGRIILAGSHLKNPEDYIRLPRIKLLDPNLKTRLQKLMTKRRQTPES